jgi:hypothetical protein
MKTITGNIWDYHQKGYWIVIPTNGSINKRSQAVMGRGLALQAKRKFPYLPTALGSEILKTGNQVHEFTDYRIYALPTKHHWQDTKSNLNLIVKGCEQLARMVSETRRVYLPYLGCGCGELNWDDVSVTISNILDDRFIVVEL